MDSILRTELEYKCRIAKRVSQAWSIKEYTNGLWDYATLGWAQKAYQWTFRSRQVPIKKVARTIKSHMYGIADAIVLCVHNARAYSINGKI